eukprot:scaffold9578_cov96-Isochrysis_galbana.AAC.1
MRGREREPTPRVPREVDHCAGAFPHPFRGREESCKHIQTGDVGPTGPHHTTHTPTYTCIATICAYI